MTRKMREMAVPRDIRDNCAGELATEAVPVRET